MTPEQNTKLVRRATHASVAVALILIVIKFIAYLSSGSVALLSSLIDSVLDSLASILNFIAVKHSLSPADEEHRFGHGKAEPLAGLGQAAFITGSSIFLIVESINRFVHPMPIQQGDMAILIMLVSLGLTMGLVAYQKHVVRVTNSVAIKADSLHYVSDITLNISVIVALVLSSYFGWTLVDPIFALAIAGYIIYSAWKIVLHSLDQLMDKELPDEERERIKAIVLRHSDVASLHELRTRASGLDIFIQLHLEMDGNLPLKQAHDIADEVEMELQTEFPNADIIIHQDPIGEERKDEIGIQKSEF